jgi:Flp pilus assembly pilin Flp
MSSLLRSGLAVRSVLTLCRWLHARSPEHGATATEYAIMVAFIAMVIFGAVLAFGQKVSDLFIIPAGAL